METNWLGGIFGGALIGLSAVLMLLFNGRITGISGIVGSLLVNQSFSERLWRALFILGLLIGAAIYITIHGELELHLQASRSLLILSGLLVGIGTNLGSGCTSGHGVCGIARLSKRSITATLIFIGVAMLTVFIKQKLGL
ncbi:MAG: YeeE/YedE family protein [Proteobacteria bacterium]|nr:YeeE/YedE family protein [Pseudomonadota bacterium]NOG61678.1 YeeE/YedE family protein [Pseudomonadota bacterium]